MGGTLDQQWQIGGELLGFFPWSGIDEGYDEDTNGFGAALFTARHYPRPQGNFFVTGGLGVGEIDLQEDNIEATGYVAKIGAGYDLRVGRTFSFTPYLALVRTFGSEARTQVIPPGGDEFTFEEDVNFGMALIGIGFTWY
jgi:hypothetical protein